MVQIIELLQRLINTGSIERWARANNIQIPIGALLQNIVINLIPVGGEYVVDLINKNLNYFKYTDAKIIANQLASSGGTFQVKKDLDFNLFGAKFSILGTDESIFEKKEFWGIVLFAILGIMFLKA